MKRLLIVLTILFISLPICFSDQEQFDQYDVITTWEETREVYKYGDGYSLNAHIFSPSDVRNDDLRPVILFFHGGGWYEGNSQGFKRNCRTFAERGWIAISFDYRLSNFSDIDPTHCIMDAKSSIRWVRENSERLSIDPHRVVIAGQSAGGHLALCTAFVEDFNDPEDDLSFSPVPNAIICYSACFDPGEDSWFYELLLDKSILDRTSPQVQIEGNGPPVLIFHGRDDGIVPFAQAERFQNRMEEMGNQCILVPFDNSGHNLWPDHHREIRVISEDFLINLGFIPQ